MTIERELAARWIVRERKDGTRYWYGKLAWDEGRFDQETLTCNAADFPVGTTIVCMEPRHLPHSVEGDQPCDWSRT